MNYPYKWYAKYYKNIDGFYAGASHYNGSKNGKGTSKGIFLHQFIMNANGEKVDHISHDTLDNRKENLRITESKHNSTNRKGKNSNNKSGYRNVSWNSIENKWLVQLQINLKNTVLGRFDDVDEAGRFAEEKRKEIYKNYAGKN